MAVLLDIVELRGCCERRLERKDRGIANSRSEIQAKPAVPSSRQFAGTQNGEVVVTDFGFARDIRESVAPGFAGTPAFMAPEQIDPFYGPIGVRTDVYGLGMCLYALLSGRPAFEGRPREVIAEIVSGNASLQLKALRADVPDGLNEVCVRAIAKQPGQRFGLAKEFGEALRSVVS